MPAAAVRCAAPQHAGISIFSPTYMKMAWICESAVGLRYFWRPRKATFPSFAIFKNWAWTTLQFVILFVAPLLEAAVPKWVKISRRILLG